MTTATANPMRYATTLMIPTAVREFFDTLREFGTIKGITAWANGGITLYLPGEDTTDPSITPGQDSLGACIMQLAQALGAKGIAPAFPTRTPGNPFGTGDYAWKFDDAVYAGHGQWSILVPPTADLLHLLECVSGLASYDRDYKGESILPVTYHFEDSTAAADMTRMREDLRSIEDDLDAWFGEQVQFTTPQRVA